MSRRRVAALLVMSLALGVGSPALAADSGSSVQGTIDGRLAGRQHPTGAFLWSFAWGTLVGLVGAGVSVAYYAVQDPSPTAEALLTLSDQPTEYRVAYLDAYRRAAHGKMVQQSLIGAGLGWVTGIVITHASSSAALTDDGGTSVALASVSW